MSMPNLTFCFRKHVVDNRGKRVADSPLLDGTLSFVEFFDFGVHVKADGFLMPAVMPVDSFSP